MNIKINGLKELNKAIDKAGRDVQKGFDAEIRRIANEILQSALARVPSSKALIKASAFIEKIQAGYTIGFSATHAAYQEFGTGPLVEVPVGYEAFAMEFFVNGEGNTPAQPFLFPAFLARRDKIVDELTQKLDAYIKSF